MKRTEKIVAASLIIALGVLLVILRGEIVSILMTVLGLALIAFGVLDLFNCAVPPAVVKLVVGVVVIFCGWLIVEAVLYVLAAYLLIAGILLLYEKIKFRARCINLFHALCVYAIPALCLVIGVLLLFNQGNKAQWVFIIGGVFTVLEGGLLLIGALADEP